MTICKNGRLIRPFPSVYRSGSSIYLVMPTHRAAKPGAVQFRDWLLEQGADAACLSCPHKAKRGGLAGNHFGDRPANLKGKGRILRDAPFFVLGPVMRRV